MKLGFQSILVEKLLIIDTDDLDFSKNQEDLGFVVDKVNAELHGLF